MTPATRSSIAHTSRAAAPVALIIFTAVILLRFPPTQFSFYPQCPIYLSLHLLCPGCGTTRALAALLHGHLVEALRLNTLTTLMLPLAAIYAAVCYHHLLRHDAFRWPQLPPLAIYTTIIVTVVFTIARNLPLHSL